MRTAYAPLSHPVRAYGGRALVLATAAVLAFSIGYAFDGHKRYALLAASLPVILVLVTRPQLTLLLGLAALPFGVGTIAGGIAVTPTDLLFLLCGLGSLVALMIAQRTTALGDARLVVLCAAPFGAWLLVVAARQGSVHVAVNVLQDYQIFVLPLFLGAVVMTRATARRAVDAFVVASTVLALIWAVGLDGSSLAGNKNPAGQFMGNAAILLLMYAIDRSRWLLLLPVLVVGLLATQSRGALVGTGVGAIVFLSLRGLGSWRRTVAVVLPVAVVVLVGYQALPDDVRARTTTFDAGSATSGEPLTGGQYSIKLRETYSQEGWELVRAHPVFGVGPGNYATGTPGQENYTVDPHNLLIRTAGDTGYPGLVAFVLLLAGTGLLAFRRRRRNPLALVALGIQTAILVHGFVDVYWVRGTPVLGWLLLGMAVNGGLDHDDA